MFTPSHEAEKSVIHNTPFMIQTLQPAAMWETMMMFMAMLWLLWVGVIINQLDNQNIIRGVSPDSATSLWLPCFVLWILLESEILIGFIITRQYDRNTLLRTSMLCVIPPLRIAYSPWLIQHEIWLFSWGWQRCDKQLFERLERLFAVPMLCIATLIIPILTLQVFFNDYIAANPTIQVVLNIILVFIWFAFAIEFVVMVAVSQNKLGYCLQNWVNLIIILLPVAAFLRYLHIFNIIKMTQIGRMLQAYRLRNLTVRIQRIAVLLNLIDRVFSRTPEKYLQHLHRQVLQKEQELKKLQDKIRILEQQLADTNNDKCNDKCAESG